MTTQVAEKYKNRTAGPLALNLPSYGDVSIPGKGTIWLWWADLQSREIKRLLTEKYLVKWNDGEEPPQAPPPRRELPNVSAKELLPKGKLVTTIEDGTEIRTIPFAESIQEDFKEEGDHGARPVVAPVVFRASEDEVSGERPSKKKRG